MAAQRPTLLEAGGILMSNEDGNVFKQATETLFKILQNVINNPDEEKYRQLNRSGAAFTTKIAPAKGAVRFLRAVGFVEQGTGDTATFVLPSAPKGSEAATLLASGKNALKALVKERYELEQKRQEQERCQENQIAAQKLADLKQASQMSRANNVAAQQERQRILDGIQIDRDDRVRQADPTNMR